MEAELIIIDLRRKSARDRKSCSSANQTDVKHKAEKIRERKRQARRRANKTDKK
jgi:KaiC/GvpD/RAD55 family RecA-like ATPase